MKKLQNSLYITRQGCYVHKEQETIVIEENKQKLLQVPAHSIANIFCFGNVLLSPFVMGFCGENNINVALYTEYGRFLARIQGRVSGNVLLRRAQYQVPLSQSVNIAKNIIAAKIQASRNILLRRIRNHGPHEASSVVVRQLAGSIEDLSVVDNLETIRGIEGEAAARYFSVFQHMVADELQQDFSFTHRSRRPPLDPLNAMLSFLYSVVGKEISGALQGVGLDPQIGFLHADRPGRDSLSQDILEEFRAWLIDRLVLNLVNRKQIKRSDFIFEGSGAVSMKSEARKQILVAWQERKKEEIMHPFLQEKVAIGLLPYVQALLLARHLRGDLEQYPAFLVR